MKKSNVSDAFFHAETAADEEYLAFERSFESLSGIHLNLYKEKQMKRRINTLIARKGLSDYEEFLNLLRADTAELDEFLRYITINVTEFFRTPEHWRRFEEEVLTDLTGHRENSSSRELKVWSCACSTGEEPYSLAMSLCRLTEPSCFRILATDIDETVLDHAKEGIYSEKSTESIPQEELLRFFERSDSGMKVTDELKSRVEFCRLDLLTDDFPKECDLIVCRNVLIYFTEEAKNRIYEKFMESLKPGGYLFTGNTEQLIYCKKYGLKKIEGYLYQKK